MFRLFHYLKRHRVYAVISPILMVGEVAADLALPFLMSVIVNYGIMGLELSDPQSGSGLADRLIRILRVDPAARMNLIAVFGIVMLMISLLGGVFGLLAAYTSSKAAQGFGHDLRCDAYRSVMHLSIEQTDRFTTGSLVTRLTSDITMVMTFMESLLRGFIRSPIFIIGGTAMLLMLHASFGIVLLAVLPVLAAVIWLVLRKAVPMFLNVQRRLDSVNSVVQENITGARVIKAYVQESYECEKFEEANAGLCSVNYRVERLIAVITPVLTLLQNYAVIFMIYLGGRYIRAEYAGMTTGAIMAAITYVTQAIGAVLMAANLFQTVSRADASAERICEILAEEAVIQGPEGTKRHQEVESGEKDVVLEFRDVDFAYPNTDMKMVLQGINLKVYRNETMAVIGPTGSGKTTLASLIPRFYDATRGSILINGLDVKDYQLKELRGKIGCVMQKAELFSETLEENIRWGKKGASESEIEEAAQIAQAADFIEAMTGKYQAFVAEKGASLSGGQKQRVSIARAVVRRPEILILDDSTSALDLATEARLRAGLKKAMSDTTVVMIAQRIASVMEADRIAVLEADGTIRHCASHEELLRVSGTYREIYESQMKSGAFIWKEGGEHGR